MFLTGKAVDSGAGFTQSKLPQLLVQRPWFRSWLHTCYTMIGCHEAYSLGVLFSVPVNTSVLIPTLNTGGGL